MQRNTDPDSSLWLHIHFWSWWFCPYIACKSLWLWTWCRRINNILQCIKAELIKHNPSIIIAGNAAWDERNCEHSIDMIIFLRSYLMTIFYVRGCRCTLCFTNFRRERFIVVKEILLAACKFSCARTMIHQFFSYRFRGQVVSLVGPRIIRKSGHGWVRYELWPSIFSDSSCRMPCGNIYPEWQQSRQLLKQRIFFSVSFVIVRAEMQRWEKKIVSR